MAMRAKMRNSVPPRIVVMTTPKPPPLTQYRMSMMKRMSDRVTKKDI
jgi:hypothetical protein